MALTKVTGDFIETGSITQGHLHSSHGITLDHIGDGSTNTFFTTANARAAISATGSLSYNNSTGVMSFTMPTLNTTNITEGNKLFFTNARAISALTAGTNIAIASNGTISSTDTNTTYSVGDGGLTQNNFTNTLKGKLDGIATGATNTAAPHYTSAIAVGDGGLTQKNFTTTLKTKLDGIAASANNYTFNGTLSGDLTWGNGYKLSNGNNSNNAEVLSATTGAAGIVLKDSGGTFKMQLYGEGGNYGFLTYEWGAWDLKKINNGELILRVSGADKTAWHSGSGSITAVNDMRAQTFYDSNNTGYYVDPASTSNVNLMISQTSQIASPPSLGAGTRATRIYMGNDANVKILNLAEARMQLGLGNSDWSRRVDYSSDTNYATGVNSQGTESLNSTVPGRMSGFIDVWSNPAGQPSGTSHWNGHQAFHYVRQSDLGNIYGYQFVVGAGNPANTYIRGIWSGSSWGSWYRVHTDTASNMYATGSFRAPIFYDSNDTNYYIDANSTSRLNTIQATEIYSYSWLRNHTANTGLYNQATVTHWYSDAQGYFNIGGGAGGQGIKLRDNHNSTVRGILYYDTSGNFGFLNSGSSWRIKCVGGDYVEYDGSSIRPRLMYDLNNTGYYVDPASTSNIYTLQTANYIKLTDSDGYIYGGSISTRSGARAIHIGYSGTCIFQGERTDGSSSAFIVAASSTQTYFYSRVSGGSTVGRRFLFMQGNTLAFACEASRYVTFYNGHGNSSDRLFKKNIEDSSYGLSEVNSLKPRRFYWKDETKSKVKQIGFIAQELEEVLPEAVRGHEGNKSIMDNSLIPVLTKAIQELSQQITDLKAEVELLKQ